MLMVDNIDCLITISLDFDKEGSRYMTFNLTKMRDKHNDKRSYFAQPFVPGSTIRLIEDAGGVPQFRESLHMVPELNNNTIIKMSGSSTMTNSIDDILDTNEIDDTNVFKKTVYTFDNDTNNDRPEPVCPISFILDDSSSDLDKMMNELDNMIA
jgi:hypothetical protein